MNMGEYGTTDTELAAYLILEGAAVTRLEKDGPTRVRFVLTALPEGRWEGYRQAFCTHEAKVSPFAYASQLRKLKGMIRNGQRA